MIFRKFVFIWIFISPLTSVAQWNLLTTTGQTLHTVYFLPGNPQIGFIGGDDGASVPSSIEKTTDGGKTWRYVGGLDRIIYDFSFKDSLTGFASSADTPACYKTTDGGETWVACEPDIHYIDPNGNVGSGYGVYYDTGNGSVILAAQYGLCISYDEGMTWTVIHNSFDDEHFGFSFSDANHGVASAWSDDGIPWYSTTNGGHTWNYLSMDSSCWQPLAIQGTNTFFALTWYGATLLRTDDGWSTWQTTHIFPENAVYYADDSIRSPGCIRGDLNRLVVQLYSGLYESTDQGINWEYLCGQPFRLPINDVAYLNVRFFVNGQYLYAITSDTNIAPGCLWELNLDSLNTFGTTFVFPVSTTQKTVTPGQKVTVNFSPKTADPIGIDSGHIVIHYDSTSLLLDSLTLPDSWVIRDSTSGSGYLDLFITADSSQPLPNPILTLIFSTYLSSSTSTKVWFDSANLSGHRLNCDCAVASVSGPDSVQINFTGCGDSILLAVMNDSLPFTIESIVPNPTTDAVQISIINPTSSAISYQVVDVLGTVRATGEVSGTALTLDVHSLPNGLYYLRARNAVTGFVASGKFVVER